MESKKEFRRDIAVLKLQRSIPKLISQARKIVMAMTGNSNFTATFPANIPSLNVINADINALETAQTITATKSLGTIEARDVKLEILTKDLRALLSYVQSVADNNLPNAATIIKSAGMDVKGFSGYNKQNFEVTHGKVSGSIILNAKCIDKRSSYEWQISSDGITWNNLPTTLQSKTSVSNLTLGETYYFRTNHITKDGEGNWSQILSIIVI